MTYFKNSDIPVIRNPSRVSFDNIMVFLAAAETSFLDFTEASHSLRYPMKSFCNHCYKYEDKINYYIASVLLCICSLHNKSSSTSKPLAWSHQDSCTAEGLVSFSAQLPEGILCSYNQRIYQKFCKTFQSPWCH